jgi:hypothetical protein
MRRLCLFNNDLLRGLFTACNNEQQRNSADYNFLHNVSPLEFCPPGGLLGGLLGGINDFAGEVVRPADPSNVPR